MKNFRFAVVVAAGCLVLTACSGTPATSGSASSAASASSSASAASSAPASASASASASATAPSSSRTIEGTGYRYTVPKGWAVPKTDVGQSQTDSLAADLTDTDGFADNVNVVVVESGSVTPEQIESQGPAQLESAGFTKVAARERVRIAGTESAHLTALQKGGTYRVDQFYLLRDGKGYIITFSFSPKVSEADRDDVSDAVLSTWTWS